MTTFNSAKPASVPTWDSNHTHEADPSSGQLTDGFATNDVVPSNVWNKIWRLTGDWLTVLDGLQSYAFSWTGAHTFTNATTSAFTVDVPLAYFTQSILVQALAGSSNDAVVGVGADNTSSGTDAGRGGVFGGGAGKIAGFFAGRGIYATGGDFYPTTSTHNGGAGSGGFHQAGTVFTDGTASTGNYGTISRASTMRNYANSDYQKGTLRQAHYVAPGIKKNATGTVVLGPGIIVQDESGGSAVGGPAENSYGIQLNPELASIQLQRHGSWSPAATDMRDTLGPEGIPAVQVLISAAAGSPVSAGTMWGVYNLTYNSTTDTLRVYFGWTGTSASFANTNYIVQFSEFGGGDYKWILTNRSTDHLEFKRWLIGTGVQNISGGSFSAELLYLQVYGNWA